MMAGLGESERNVLPWRLKNDLCLISHEKNLMALTQYAHEICTARGIATWELLDHTVEQKHYPKASY